MVEAIDWTGAFVTGLMNDWPEWCHGTKLGCASTVSYGKVLRILTGRLDYCRPHH